MMDDHDIRESKEMIESDYVVQRRCSMATNVPHDDSLCEQSVDDGCWGFGPSIWNAAYQVSPAQETALGYSVGLRR